ncbi:MAG: glucosaminidase domain-containing protein [Phascolarctobacterium sp.]|nr:glucosaminidase domain-containing protein [Phascolarctobacterium sp.]
MKFLKFPAVLAVASCFFINSIANATVKEEHELSVAKPVASKQEVKTPSKSKKELPRVEAPAQNKKEAPKPKVISVKKEYFRGMELPANYKSISIFGSSVATRGQAVNLIKANGSKVKLDCSIEEIVNLYWVEAEREGVRPDIALAQALVETGYFGYGGTVQPKQNNFCGLGTTGKKVKGAKFKTPEIGVRAHIQHLLAYSTLKKPSTNIVDPRYDLAHSIRKQRGLIDKWSGLQSTWAMGSEYCEKIMVVYQAMLGMEMSEAEKKELLEKQRLAEEQHKARLKKDKKYRKQFEAEAKARKQAEKEAKKDK